jgi:hypothetical protein
MYREMYLYNVYREGGDRDVWRASTGVIHYVFDQIEPTKLLYHPKQKPRRGGGLRQINTCRQIPLQVNFLEKPPFRIRVY